MYTRLICTTIIAVQLALSLLSCINKSVEQVSEPSLYEQIPADSLLYYIQDESLEDSVRVAIALKAITNHERVAYDSAFHLIRYAQNIGKQSKKPKLVLKAKIDYALHFLVQSHMDSALHYLLEAKAIADKINAEQENGIIIANLGYVDWVNGDYDKALEEYKLAYSILEKFHDTLRLADLENRIGIIHQDQARADVALRHFQRALEMYKSLNDSLGMADTYVELAIIYSTQGKFELAESYARKSLDLEVAMGDPFGMAMAYLGLGNINLKAKDFKEALQNFTAAKLNAEIADDRHGTADAHIALAKTYVGIAEQSHLSKDSIGNSLIPNAENHFEEGMPFYVEFNNPYYMTSMCLSYGKLQLLKQKPEEAFEWCERALQIAEGIKGKAMMASACDCLSKSARKLGKFEASIGYLEQKTALADSVINRENIERLKAMELDYAFKVEKDSLKQENIKSQLVAQENKKRERLVMGGSLVFLLLVAGGLFSRYKVVKKKNSIIESEKEKSNELLLNILPQETADELLENGFAKAQKFEEVTVLYSDIKDFTKIGNSFDAELLVEELNYCFSAFDNLLSRYKVEKIKTVGDAYICAAGLPSSYEDAAFEAVQLALDMQSVMKRYQEERIRNNKPYFQIRIGLHTGPVVAGIVGIKKFAYDIWGDTVNTAARMEQNCEVGMVNVSSATKSKLGNSFIFESRGKLAVKGKGDMEMFYIKPKA